MSKVLTLLALWLLLTPSRAGELIVFVPGAEFGGAEKLAHLELKGVITEFLDPQDTGLGKSLGYLIWAEWLSAISDQGGAGVILARPPDEQRVTSLAQGAYHDAAIEIARRQRAPIALWGRVTEEGGHLIVDTACTLLPEIADTALKVQVSVQKGGDAGPPLQAVIPRTRFSFGWVATNRNALFARAILTARSAELRTAPDDGAKVVARLPAERGLVAEDMDGAWFRVKADGGNAFIHASDVKVPPAEVLGSGQTVSLHAKPDRQAQRLTRVKIDGARPVLDARYLATGIWYRIEAGGVDGWVEGWRVTPRFSLPAVHFMAGLYRYFGGRYAQAAHEFEQFLSRGGEGARNRVLATAHQLHAASLMLKERHAFSADKEAVLAALREAARLTPYDPTSYNLQAVAQLGIFPEPAKALAALDQALALDPADPGARGLAITLEGIAAQPEKSPYRDLVRLDRVDRERLDAIKRSYRIEAQPLPQIAPQ